MEIYKANKREEDKPTFLVNDPMASSYLSSIIIHGLRRSGTTILWETLRSNPALRCYDEPFHPRFAAGERENSKGTWTELAEEVDAAATFGPLPQRIDPLDELSPETSREQRAWLSYLMHSRDRVVIDMVRCWNRLPGLYPKGASCLTVHLVRDPAGWATAHLLPTGGMTLRKHLGDAYRRATFFRRKGYFDNYQYQQIVDAALQERHAVFNHVALSHDELAEQPAYIRLLAFWWGANLTLRKSIQDAGLPAATVTLAEYARDPDTVLHRICLAAGWPSGNVDTSRVAPVRPSFAASSKKWRKATECLGIPDSLFEPERQTAEDVEHAFDAALKTMRSRSCSQ